ncbi:MAG TPA: FliG C-terminal domain-containing protein [Sedimentisphaerales bacterium]|nr:FliG C-terminal domain-containing protein [Sedimentisphaerales bacterium]HQG47796.1 FliG C-terminal domain-containing protein [Sedimentisphaerales bacterium]HQI28166.1 FliG C-terminal domain-containing protein [Sedimentisphaerales bacterium]
MPLTGKQKAALLLTTLDAATAAELLKGVDPKTVQELAVELSYLDAAGQRNDRQTADVARQFAKSLQKDSTFSFKTFLKEMLRNTVGEEQARRIQQEIQDLLQKRDPFMSLRSADLQSLKAVLETEHPQAIAVVLSELPPRRGSEVLGQLSEDVRVSVISRMTSVGSVPPEARMRIAQMVRTRLEAAETQNAGAVQARPEQALRKIAVIVRNLEKEVRDGVLEAIGQKDQEAAEKITNLMITWEDLPMVGDRSLQQALRGLDERQLALALHEAPEEFGSKIKSNISERAATMVAEEASLMSSPKKEDVREAREKIVAAMRELNRKGELTFEEE